VLINNSLTNCGLNSFLASSDLLASYGYLADLRYYEDSEYMQGLQFFQVPHLSSAAVGHYLHTEPHPDYVSLASPWRLEVHAIEDHPYLCGSVVAAASEGSDDGVGERDEADAVVARKDRYYDGGNYQNIV
jgi:hypothetical protein